MLPIHLAKSLPPRVYMLAHRPVQRPHKPAFLGFQGGASHNSTMFAFMRKEDALALHQVILGTVYLGNGSSATIDHGLDIEANLLSISTTFCDSDPDARQLVTVQVVGKTSNAFTLSCVPANASNTASIDFSISQLVM